MRHRTILRGVNSCVAVLCAAVGCSVYSADIFKDDGSSGGNGNTGSGGAAGEDGSGGTAPSSGGGSGGNDPGSGGLGGSSGELELIDDMEDGNSTIRFIDARTGNWDVYHAGAGTQVPAVGFTSMIDDTGAPDSDYAAYTMGEGSDWASLNVSMKNGLAEYDARAYSGLSFRAKVGADSVTTVRLRVVTGDTDPSGDVCGDLPKPPCYDHFAIDVDLTEDWETYVVGFEEFNQLAPAFESINIERVIYFEFYFDGAAPYEFWVDDLSFVKN